jgi:hypothetical protein
MQPDKIRIYYDTNGTPFFQTNVYNGATSAQDIANFKLLSERNRNTFDYIELPFGAYAQDFAEGTLTGVDVTAKTPKFSYGPQQTIPTDKPLTEQLAELKSYTQQMNEDFTALADFATGGGN